MRIQAYEIDEQGFIKEVYVIEENEAMGLIKQQPPQGLYRARWTGVKWVEDMTQEEIHELNNKPLPITESERIAMLEQAINDLMMIIMMGGI